MTPSFSTPAPKVVLSLVFSVAAYAILFVRGERPIKDLKYDILRHPNVALTADGKMKSYKHGTSINNNRKNIYLTEEYKIISSEEIDDYLNERDEKNEK